MNHFRRTVMAVTLASATVGAVEFAHAETKYKYLTPVAPTYAPPATELRFSKRSSKAPQKAARKSSQLAPQKSPQKPSQTAPQFALATAVPQAPQAAAQSKTSLKEADVRARHLQAVEMLLTDNTRGALSILQPLSTTPGVSPDELDRIFITMGRAHYQAGQYNEALEAYQKVRKGSASWLESLEEKSWTHMKLNQPQDAMAAMKTVLSPLFQDRTTAEPYFLTALAQLRVCDYSAMFKTIELFKGRFRNKIKTWEASLDPADKARLRDSADVIQKLNLVEAEAIQKLYIDESGKRHKGSVPGIARGRNQISFPDIEGDEVWLDEVDDYRVTIKGCPQPAIVPATMLAGKEK